MSLTKEQKDGIADILDRVLEDIPYPKFDAGTTEQVYACNLLDTYDHPYAMLAKTYLLYLMGNSLSLGAWLKEQGIDVASDLNRLIRHRYEWITFVIEDLRS